MMDSDQKTYELRSRSRSRSETPLKFSRIEGEDEGSEHRYDLRSKSRDRSLTPGIEVTSSRRSTSRSLPSSVIKARNKNMEAIDEQQDNTLTDIMTETKSTVEKFETTEKSTKNVERRSERQKIKRQIFSNGQSELKDNYLNTNIDKRTMTSDYSSEDGEREVPSRPTSAHEFYKQQGDYWNKFPKTDYTYSPTSSCRYEIAPGVMAIPNMSRRSLHSENGFFSGQTNSSQSFSQSSSGSFSNVENTLMDFSQGSSGSMSSVKLHNRNNKTAGQSISDKRTVPERSHRKAVLNSSDENERYKSWTNNLNYYSINNHYRKTANFDSDTDFDDVVTSTSYKLKSSRKSGITSLIFSVLHFITFGQFKKQEYSSSHYRYNRETKWNSLWRLCDTVLQHMYLLFVKIILLDSWLLSRVSKLRDRAQGRSTKILWLLLPLALAIGYLFLPLILSAIPLRLNYQQMFPVKVDRKTPVVQSYSPEDFKTNQELKNLVNLLINRVQYLEAAKSEQSIHLANVTQAIEDIRRTDYDAWIKYDKKLLNLEQELELKSSERENSHAEELDLIRVEVATLKQLYTRLKTCCDTIPNVISEDEIQKQADKVFAGYFGDGFSKDDVVRIFQIMNSKIRYEEIQKSTSGAVGSPGDEPKKDSTSIDMDEIRNMIMSILKIYDADKTGRVDYALESAGGQIISTRCTQKYNVHTRAFKILGMTIYYESNNPRTVIQGNTIQPGMCWAFQDYPGYLLIKLRSPIHVTGFTLEHASRTNLPNGEMKSAPRKFDVWGLRGENDFEPVMFGEYEFLVSDDSLQYFPVQNSSINEAYEYVELRIHSNHGQLEYTCLYRFRVHGNLA